MKSNAYILSQLFGAFYCARVAARAFIKLGVKGSIVFTASMASYRPNKVGKPITFRDRLSKPLTCNRSAYHQRPTAPRKPASAI